MTDSGPGKSIVNVDRAARDRRRLQKASSLGAKDGDDEVIASSGATVQKVRIGMAGDANPMRKAGSGTRVE